MVIPESFFMYTNLIVLAIYIVFILYGYHRGFLVGAISMFGSFFAFFGAWRYSSVVVKYFHPFPTQFLPLQDTLLAEQAETFVNQIMWFVILYLLIVFAVKIIEELVRGIQKAPGIHIISAVLGGVLGLITATIWMLAICVVLNSPFFENGYQLKQETILQSIADVSETAVESLGVPISSSDAINSLYTNAVNLDDADKEAIELWLEEHGFEKLDAYKGGSEE